MALGTVTVQGSSNLAPLRPLGIYNLTVVGDGDYPTGGYDLAARLALSTGLNLPVEIVAAEGYGMTAGAITHACKYDKTNDLLLVFVESTGAEVANGGDLAAVTLHLTIFVK